MTGSMMSVLFTRPFWTASAQKITMVNFFLGDHGRISIIYLSDHHV